MDIKVDDLSNGEVIILLEQHLADMYATSPAESVHALNVDALKAPEITFFSGWDNGELMGCVAIKALDGRHVELKSMRTATASRRLGVASQLLTHVIEAVSKKGYQQISLETGSQAFFQPARHLYEKFGFTYCEPFADYTLDPHSRFMSYTLR